jgi:hypothetical protein
MWAAAVPPTFHLSDLQTQALMHYAIALASHAVPTKNPGACAKLAPGFLLDS